MKLSRATCAAFFVGAGVLHFARPRMYEQIVPPGFGDPRVVVALSGAAEILGGLALAGVAGVAGRHVSRWWLIGLLVAVFPANVYMALEPERTGGSGLPGWLLWARLPLQGVLIYWVWRATRGRAAARVGGDPLAASGPL
jgi:uncharacterized membrane protein